MQYVVKRLIDHAEDLANVHHRLTSIVDVLVGLPATEPSTLSDQIEPATNVLSQLEFICARLEDRMARIGSLMEHLSTRLGENS